MIGLFDRDVFLKLGCCALWEMAVEAVEVTQPFRLSSTSSEMSNRKAVGRMLRGIDIEPSILRIMEMVRSVPTLSDTLVDGIEASDGFQCLADIDGIDGGERVLAAILIRDPAARVLVSGDKRFVQAMQTSAPTEWAAIRHGVISFESCLLAIERVHGFDAIVEKALPVCCCDGSLRLAFGQHPDAENFRQALSSFNPC